MLDISQRCARSLGKLDPSIERDGARLRFAGRDVRLRARVENEAGAGAQHLLGLAVDVEVDGAKHPVTDGVVGIGATRDEAVDAAIHWWSRLAGAPIVAAPLAARRIGREIAPTIMAVATREPIRKASAIAVAQ